MSVPSEYQEWLTLGQPSTAAVSQEVVLSAIDSNQNKGNLAVAEVANLTVQIGQLLDTLANAQDATVVMGESTTEVDPFTSAAVPTAPVLPAFPTIGSLETITPDFPTLGAYTSDLITQLQSTLFSLVANMEQTGLNPVIEQQIWDRGRERTSAKTRGVIDSVTRGYARAGWTMPSGDLIEKINQANEMAAIEDITESRAVAIAQAELEQKNFQFSISQSVMMEKLLTELFTTMQQLAVESEKSRINSLNELNKTTADVYKSQVQGVAANTGALSDIYKADAQVFSSVISGEAERMKAQVSLLEAENNYLFKSADISIESIKANVATFLGQKDLTASMLRSVAQIWSQLAASFGSAVNYSAGISASDSTSRSKSESVSNSSSFSNSVSTVISQ